MAESVDIEHVHEDLLELRQELQLIKNILAEDYELSEEAKESVEEARNVSDEDLVSHDKVSAEKV